MIKNIKNIVLLIIYGGVGASFALLLLKNNPYLSRLQLIMSFGLLFLSFFIHILIHEYGHLIAGKLSGYKFASYRIGSLLIKKENEKLVTKRYSLPGTGGQCLMRPPELNQGNYPVILYNLGGGLLNLIFASLAFLLTVTTDFADIFLIPFGVAGAVLAMINLIPMNLKIPNDGYNAFYLSKDMLAKRALWLQLESNAKLSEGKKINDIPEELFELLPDADLKNHLVLSIPYLKICRLIEKEDYEQAKLLFEKYKDERAFLDLYKLELESNFLGNDILEGLVTQKSEVDKRLIQYLERTPNILLHSRVLYSYFLFIDKNQTKAEYYRMNFYKLAPKYPYPLEIEYEKEQILRVNKMKEITQM